MAAWRLEPDQAAWREVTPTRYQCSTDGGFSPEREVTMANLVHDLALVACAFLLIWWLVVSRRLAGLALAVAGIVLILVLAFSDHNPAHMVGLLAGFYLVGGLLLAGAGLARSRRQQVRVYVAVRPQPAPEPREARPEEARQAERARRVQRSEPVQRVRQSQEQSYVVNRGQRQAGRR